MLLGGLAALAGCTTEVRLPWVPPSPLPVQAVPELTRQIATANALAAHLVAKGETWPLKIVQLDTLNWFVGAIDEHVQVLQSTDPGRRQRGTAALPSVPPASQRNAAATYAALTILLRQLHTAHRTRALAATGPAALLWGSLAAFSATMAARLSRGISNLGDDTTGQTPDLAGTSAGTVLTLCRQAGYSYEMALAATGLKEPQEDLLRARLAGWQSLAASIERAAPQATSSPAPIGYDLKPARDAAGAYSLAANTEAAALPILGAWLAGTASSAERELAVDALVQAGGAAVDVGGKALRWPGWPG